MKEVSPWRMTEWKINISSQSSLHIYIAPGRRRVISREFVKQTWNPLSGEAAERTANVARAPQSRAPLADKYQSHSHKSPSRSLKRFFMIWPVYLTVVILPCWFCLWRCGTWLISLLPHLTNPIAHLVHLELSSLTLMRLLGTVFYNPAQVFQWIIPRCWNSVESNFRSWVYLAKSKCTVISEANRPLPPDHSQTVLCRRSFTLTVKHRPYHLKCELLVFEPLSERK